MASRERPLDVHELSGLLALAEGASDHMPFRLKNEPGTVALRDVHGVVLADLLSTPIATGVHLSFDRYLVRAINEAPALALEVQRLRVAIAKAVRDGRAHHAAEPCEPPDLHFFLTMLSDLEKEIGAVT